MLAVVLAVSAGLAGCSTSRVNIEGDAMAPTLKNGEQAVVQRSIDRLDRGDIVTFRYPKDETKSFLKRIVGLPGETISSVDGRISIDGKPLEESYVLEPNRSHDTWGPIAIPPGEYFMMGDNRRNSSDSRSWGLVTRDAIWGKAGVR